MTAVENEVLSTTSVGPGIAEPKSPRYKSLDVWRGIACLMVVVFHSTFYAAAAPSDGSISSKLLALTEHLSHGVPMFFVISGYCISATADSARRRPFGFREFLTRRVRRIYPPYWAWIAISAPLVVVSEHFFPHFLSDSIHPIANPRSLSLWQWIGNLTLTESWRFHFGGHKQYFMGQAWTLCYEEQFYILAGIVLLVSKRHFFPTMLAISGLVFAMRHMSLTLEFSEHIRGFFFDGSWLMFAAGILVYFQINYAEKRMFVALNALLAIAIAYSVRSSPIEGNFLSAYLFASLLIGINRWDSNIMSMRALGPIAYVGTMCYSLYLVHWPVVKACSHGIYLCGFTSAPSTIYITIPTSILTSLLVAQMFHVSVERRFLNPTSVSKLQRSDVSQG